MRTGRATSEDGPRRPAYATRSDQGFRQRRWSGAGGGSAASNRLAQESGPRETAGVPLRRRASADRFPSSSLPPPPPRPSPPLLFQRDPSNLSTLHRRRPKRREARTLPRLLPRSLLARSRTVRVVWGGAARARASIGTEGRRAGQGRAGPRRGRGAGGRGARSRRGGGGVAGVGGRAGPRRGERAGGEREGGPAPRRTASGPSPARRRAAGRLGPSPRRPAGSRRGVGTARKAA